MEEGRGRRTLELLTILLLGIAFILILVHEFLKWLYQSLKPKKPKHIQRRINEYVISDEYPYLKRYDEKTVEDMELELYGESTAELDIQDEEDN